MSSTDPIRSARFREAKQQQANGAAAAERVQGTLPPEQHAATKTERCPDGSWSKWLVRSCVLPVGHTGPHKYEMRVIQERKS